MAKKTVEEQSLFWVWAYYGWYWLPVLAYGGFIFFLSSQSLTQKTISSIFEIVGDKGLHMVEYGVLGILCYRGFRYASSSWSAHYAVYLAIAAATFYGATDEFHQSFIPLREADHWDLVADCIGAAIFTAAWHWIQPFWGSSKDEVRV
jgi:VanZ family protein